MAEPWMFWTHLKLSVAAGLLLLQVVPASQIALVLQQCQEGCIVRILSALSYPLMINDASFLLMVTSVEVKALHEVILRCIN